MHLSRAFYAGKTMWPIALLSFLAPGLVSLVADTCSEGEYDTFPGSCSRYYLCEDGGWRASRCDPPKVFHPSRRSCVDPEEYECGTPAECTPWGTIRTSPDCRRYELCYRGSWLIYGCPRGQAFHFQLYLCVPAEDGGCPGCGVDQPDPGDCGAFFTCRGSKRIRELCQGGQVFDSLVGGCVPRKPWQQCESKESAVTPTTQPTTSADASIDGSTAVNPSSLATQTTDITDSAPHLTTEQSPTELSTPNHSPSTSPKTEASLLTSEPFTDYSSSPSEVHLTTELRSRTEQILITPLTRGASSTNMQTSTPPITTKILPISKTVNPQATSSFVKIPTFTTLIIMTTKEHFPERQKNSTQSNLNYLTTQSMEAGSQSVTGTNPSADSRNENSDLVPTASSTGMLSPNALTPSAQMAAITPSVITTSAKVTTVAPTAATSAIYNTSSLTDISQNDASQVMTPTYSGNGYEGSDATSTTLLNTLPANMTPQQYIISPTTTNHLPFIATKNIYSSDRTTNGFSILSSISTKGEPPSEKTRSSNDDRSIRSETSSERPTLPFTITLSYEKPTISTGQESSVSSEETTVELNLTTIPTSSNGSKIEFHTTFASTEIITNDQNSASGIEETSAIAVTSVMPFSFTNSSNPMENKTTVDSRAILEISGHTKPADSDTTPGTPLDKMTSHSIFQPESPSTDWVVQAITKSSVTTEISTEPYMDAGTKVTTDSNISFITDQTVVNYTTKSVNSRLPSVTPPISSTRTTEIPRSYSTAEPTFTSSAATYSIMAEVIPSAGTDVSPTAVGTTLCISGRRLPDVFNCRRYYFCDEHGLWVSKSCFWFFHFDSFSLECRFWNARCEHL